MKFGAKKNKSMDSIRFSLIALIAAVVGGLIVAIPTWKVQKYFISRRDYYRKAPNEIFDVKYTAALTMFMIVGGIIYVYLVDNFNL